jgi:hypothetical protein
VGCDETVGIAISDGTKLEVDVGIVVGYFVGYDIGRLSRRTPAILKVPKHDEDE